MAGTASISGLSSGMDTAGIISKMMDIEKQPVTALQTRQAALTNKLAAWQEANTRVLALKDKAAALAQESTFQTKSFKSGDETIIKGTASYTAQSGTYYLKVNSLARAEMDKTQAYADATAQIGTGTLSIKVGAGEAKTITVDGSCGTLAGLRDAINSAKAGVTATIVDDGSGATGVVGATPYRLVITSNTVGATGQLTIDTAGLTGGAPPAFSVMQAAQPASITMGEGAGAITVTRNSNEISDVISGVTLDLQSFDASKVVTLRVDNNTTPLKQTVQGLVEQYNNLMDFIDQQFEYDTTLGASGVLFGDQTLQAIQSDLNDKMFGAVGGLSGTMRTLSQLGISTSTTDGKLLIDETALDKALSSNLDDVKALFVLRGETSSPNVSFLASGPNTKASGTAGFAVEITTIATQSSAIASAAQSGNLAQDEILTINGQNLNLTANMTPDEVLAQINKITITTGVTATRENGAIKLTSAQYGSQRTITATSTVASGGSGIGEGITVTAGLDVAGTINGESATGNGQILTGYKGNANTDGLALKITAATIGTYGTVNVSKGLGSQLSDYFAYITDSTTGAISNAEGAVQSNIDQMKKDIEDMQVSLQAKEDQLNAKFAAMEATLSKLKSDGDYIASQVKSWSGGK